MMCCEVLVLHENPHSLRDLICSSVRLRAFFRSFCFLAQRACPKRRVIDRANVTHCSGAFAEAVLLRRTYAIMKDATRARRRGVSPLDLPPKGLRWSSGANSNTRNTLYYNDARNQYRDEPD